jgi:thioredoxin 1
MVAVSVKGGSMSDLVKHITDADFEAAVAAGTTLIDFWAPWCGPCKAIAPILDELAGEYEGRLQVAKINIDENQDIAGRFGVMSIPTLILFKDGQKVTQKVGGAAKAALKEFIDQAF